MSSVGWLALGTGTEMNNADMLVAWPFDGSWVLSRRQASGHVQPQVVSTTQGSSTQDLYQLVPELSTVDSQSSHTSVAFLRTLSLESAPGDSQYKVLTRASGQRFVYAMSSRNPSSSDPAAQIVEHNRGHGTVTLDLSRTVSATTLESEAESEGGEGGGESEGGGGVDPLITAHAVFGGLAFGLVAPLGIIVGRFGRAYRKWWIVHGALQFLASIFTVIAFATGWAGVGSDEHLADSHKKVGLALLILVLVQSIYGYTVHFTRLPSPQSSHSSLFPTLASGKSPLRYYHVLIGIGILVLGWVQVGALGFDEWNDAETTEVPTAVIAIFWILVGLTVAVWLVGWGFEAFKARRRQRRGDDGSTSSSSDVHLATRQAKA